MKQATSPAAAVAASAVAAAGFTPCTASAFVSDGRAFAFSVESVDGSSSSGPAFEVVVDVETAAVVRSFGQPRA